MPRIYFDTNVFSHLKRGDSEPFVRLNESLNEYKDNLTFYFSHAHIKDKLKDKTDFKFADFDFIEGFAKDNYLSYHSLKKRTSQYLATPRMAYDDEKDAVRDPRSLFSMFSTPDPDNAAVAILQRFFDAYQQTGVRFDKELLAGSAPEHKDLLSKFLPLDIESPTMGDVFDRQLLFYEDIFSEFQSYKEVRKMTDEAFNNCKITLTGNDATDFNEAFKDTAIGKTFLKFVFDAATKDKDGNIEYYHYFQLAYYSLDLLGIKKDKINRKNTITNLMNDGLHAYYGQYCDYFVTFDDSMYHKSKAIYNLFDIKTKVLTVAEFADQVADIGRSTDPTMFRFFEKISRDICEGKIIEEKMEDSRESIAEEVNEPYFGFFDFMMVVKERDLSHYFLRKKNIHALSAPNFREQGMIIDQAVQIFGPDAYDKLFFDFDAEVNKASDEVGIKRLWRVGAHLIFLQTHDGLKEFCLLISPLDAAMQQQ